ncbi:hypothetical protein [Acetobacter aceti]|uniref:hypothetical protein n=1 Tax=Acetobacter aceti TaxID=435 RepID=UPI0002260AAB|nr:hypothetical protein [Acetobacter aceti]
MHVLSSAGHHRYPALRQADNHPSLDDSLSGAASGRSWRILELAIKIRPSPDGCTEYTLCALLIAKTTLGYL